MPYHAKKSNALTSRTLHIHKRKTISPSHACTNKYEFEQSKNVLFFPSFVPKYFGFSRKSTMSLVFWFDEPFSINSVSWKMTRTQHRVEAACLIMTKIGSSISQKIYNTIKSEFGKISFIGRFIGELSEFGLILSLVKLKRSFTAVMHKLTWEMCHKFSDESNGSRVIDVLCEHKSVKTSCYYYC